MACGTPVWLRFKTCFLQMTKSEDFYERMIDIKLRKLTAVTTTLCMVMTLAACTRDDRSADITTAAVTTEEGTTAEADSSSMEAKEPSASVTSNGEVSIFYASYEYPYISSVRAVGKNLEKAGIAYQEYDSGNSQETQNEQVSLAIADGTSAFDRKCGRQWF